MAYEHILTSTDHGVGVITLNRPKALNALSTSLMRELGKAALEFDQDDTIGVIVLAGNEMPLPPVPISRKWPGATSSMSMAVISSPLNGRPSCRCASR